MSIHIFEIIEMASGVMEQETEENISSSNSNNNCQVEINYSSNMSKLSKS